MHIKRQRALAILFSVLLIVGAATLFTAPRSHALAPAQENTNQSGARKTKAPRKERQTTEVTSADRHIACKRNCEEKYYSCVAAKEAKGWSEDRAEKTCGLAGRTCKTGCDRR
ncbi:MAG: hypothetical protein QOE96_2987 [Blastocatellia bacterium]|jgi:hypothetical protein|nr:hypothetical protein [Blastocatellia bacterium]